MLNRRQLFTTLAGGALAAAAAPKQKTNFVFILADDLGARDLACYGNPHVATPNLDRLAREGAKFSNAYAACPVCSPTRASILTGRYPVRTGVTDWIAGRKHHPQGPVSTPLTATELKLSEETIAEKLKPAGYRSASVGKWHLGGEGFSPVEQGFDINIGGNQSGSPPRSDRPYFGPFKLPGIDAGPGEFLTGKLTDAACGFIKQNRANPFFLYLPHYTVHLPLGAREEAVERHRRKADGRYNPIYAAMIESLDDSVGRVLGAVEDAGVADRTMVVFFSDNGGLRYEGASKNAVTSNSPFRAGKGHLYEGGIREPLLVRFPGMVKPGTMIEEPVSSVDFLPTICALAGVKAGPAVDGVDLAPLWRGQRLKQRPLFWHYPHYSNQGGEPGSAIRLAAWKLIRFHVDNRSELFDLSRDEGERVNLIARRPEVARNLSMMLDRWLASTGAIMPARNPNADPAWPGWQLTGEERPTPPA